MRTTCALFCVLAMLGPVAATARAAAAKDESVEFLHLLQKEGFGDEAVDYLNQLKDDPNAPKEITDLWDLEMSRSKSEAAKHAYSPSEAKQYNEESKAYLDKFVKAHPDRPEAIQEEARVAEERAAEGQSAVIRAKYSTDPAEKTKLLAQARTIFDEIRPRFVDAAKASAALLAKLPVKPASRREDPRREELLVMMGENRLTLAMVDFYLGQSQEEAAAQRSPGPGREGF